MDDLATGNDTAWVSRRVRASSIYSLFVCWTLFSVFVYARYSQLGDSSAYLAGAYSDDVEARTLMVALLATRLIGLLHSEMLAHLVFSLFAASGVAYMVTQSRVSGRYRWPLLAVLLLPNFGVWSSVIGRESLFVGLLGYFMGAVIGYCRTRGLLRLVLALACLAGMLFIRTAYGAGLALFFLMFLLYTKGPRVGLSVGVQFLVFVAIAALVLPLIWPFIDGYITSEVLPKARSYFTRSSETTRLWVSITSTSQLFKSLWWTLPLALVGPTPGEVMARPVMLPFFAAGLAVCGVLVYSIGVALRAPRGFARKLLVLGWLPAVMVILVTYVPFGVYNPGSGIRYASCFLLFLIFPSMLLSALEPDEATTPDIRQGRGASR